MSHFFALDVETANADMSSICQIGIVEFHDHAIIDSWKTLLDPQDYFDPINIYIHGITPQSVIGAPTFEQVYPALQSRLQNQIVVTRTHFDITALGRACEKYDLPELAPTWLDSARVVRRHWESLRYTGYGFIINLLSLSCGLLLYASALAAYHHATPRGTLALGFALLVAFALSLVFIQL